VFNYDKTTFANKFAMQISSFNMAMKLRSGKTTSNLIQRVEQFYKKVCCLNKQREV